ncbi:MAG TPA: DNA mismatch repair endonuclease MutL [Candidatus Dormibacteraeota bacterium]|nr:DNA mismatch repair endonuclease MutL [Candidatus Dormibacteraeota bacterium]
MAGGEGDPTPGVSEAPAASGGRRVRVLPAEIADQIAAGEVVERPASVVKELIENALDAGSRRIAVDLEQAGTALIAVVDDGEGMGADDAVTAFARHATSKLHSVDDLSAIATLGFRGEALASIAAVSRTTLITRRGGELAGTRVVMEHGRQLEAREVGTPVGTRVEVAELFGNVPARRKFLKAPATEVGHVSELVTRTALAWPQVGFTLRHGGRVLVELAAVADDAERIRQVFGRERATAMLPFAHRAGGALVHGWLSDSHLSLPSPRQLYTYVNRRYVRDKLVTHALLAGYSTLLMHGRYPAAAVFVEVPCAEVDVNVHPAKSEVRFRHGGAVHELLARGVQARLRDQRSEAPRSTVGLGAVAPPQIPLRMPPRAEGATAVPPPLRLVDLPAPAPYRPSAPLPAVEADEAPAGFFAALRPLGQVFEGYLICEGREQLVLIDQHAAHERVTFERLRSAYASGLVPRQQLLVPAVVELGPREAALLGEQIDTLDAVGFEVEAYGGGAFAVRAVPALLADSDAVGLLRDVATDLVDVGRSRRLDQAAEAVLSRLACHSAVRVGQNMGPAQMRALLQAMDAVDFSGNCPHGRPAFLVLSRGDLERWFKRT